MNRFHRWVCRSSFWRAGLQNHLLPWALDGVTLGGAVLEIGPGPGMATAILLRRVPRLIALEFDAALAAALPARTPGTNLRVVRGDGALLPFPDAVFSAVVCFTMLHHVPSAEAQERLLREARRVLQPGGWFAGSDSRPSRSLAWMHYRDTYVPIDPASFPTRLRQAGFTRVQVDSQPRAFRFQAR